jgi:hypothetical protein
LFSSRRKEKKTKEKKTIQKKKKCREGNKLSFKLPLCPFTFGSCICPPAFAFPFFPFCFKRFLLASFSSQVEEKKKKHKEKKTIEKKKKCKKGMELTFLLSLLHLG